MLPRLDTFLATGVPKPTRVPCVCHCPCQPYTRSARRHTGCRHVSYRPHSGISLTLHEQILQSTLQNHSARTGRLCFPPVPNTQFHSLLSGRCSLSGSGPLQSRCSLRSRAKRTYFIVLALHTTAHFPLNCTREAIFHFLLVRDVVFCLRVCCCCCCFPSSSSFSTFYYPSGVMLHVPHAVRYCKFSGTAAR